jgi:hypothetical protein
MIRRILVPTDFSPNAQMAGIGGNQQVAVGLGGPGHDSKIPMPGVGCAARP